MSTEKFVLRPADASLAARRPKKSARSRSLWIIAAVPLVLLAPQPLAAQTSSESERLEKLERAVEQLQKRNAQLEDEVSRLKRQRALAAEGQPLESKPKVTSEGKTYVEKEVVTEEKKPVYVSAPGAHLFDRRLCRAIRL